MSRSTASFFVLFFLSSSLLLSQNSSRQSYLSESSILEYYESCNYLDHDFNYEQVLKKQQLLKLSNNVATFGYVSEIGLALVNGLLAYNNGWNEWIDMPIAVAVMFATLYPTLRYSMKLRSRSEDIPDYGSSYKAKGDSLYSVMKRRLYLYESRCGTDSWQYADCKLWCAMLCACFGDNKQACRLRDEALAVFSKCGNGPINGCDTIQQIFLYDLNSKLQYNSGCELAAIKEKEKATRLKKSYFGKDSEVYLQSLLDMSELYSERLEFDKSFDYHKQAQKPYLKKIKEEFCNLSESDRAMYWATASRYIDRTITVNHNYTRKHVRQNNTMSEAAYDALLLRKGLLLNTTLEFERFVQSSGNVEAIRHLKQKKQLSSRGTAQSIADSMDYVILADLESKGQSYNIPHLSITWIDVQSQLNEDDIAIEFYRTSNNEYGAVLLKKSWSGPKSVRLPDYCRNGKKEVRVDALLKSGILELSDIPADYGNLLWNVSKSVWTDEIIKYFPVSDEGKVYFSPDGNLQITGIEYLPIIKPKDDGNKVTAYRTVSDIYNVFRLSSTRQLVLGNGAEGKDAAVYGGLDYGMSGDMMKSDTQKHGGKRGGFDNFRGNVDMSWDALEATKEEAMAITDIINDSHLEALTAKAYTDQQGTESSFKDLSEKENKVIHIATHGFYDGAGLFDGDPLNASGLCFAGANNRFEVNEDTEDGIVTAKEVSMMDLRGLSLLTLSACETGLGSITTDGVFGLQRGFKMAGAQSILMSMWKVNDVATCKLMTEFYTNWIAKRMTKHDALEAAKRTIRETPGWEGPEYWAAFILLDGLD